jgi:2-haloacid dehalogenase
LILSAEVFRHYKPDPQTYLGVADVFDVAPAQVMLVASHEDDLDAAAACGLQTAYVSRPMELGPGVRIEHGDLSRFTVSAQDFNDLADRLTDGWTTPLQP